MICKLVIGTALFAPMLVGQLSFGILGGVPFNNLTKGVSSGTLTSADKSGMYTIGPTVQFGLPLGLRLEADVLYRPVGLTVAGQSFTSSQWRFPVLLQYRFSKPVLKPYVEGGYSYDRLQLTTSPTLSSYSITSHHGIVFGAGVDFKVPFVRVSPEIRFTQDTGKGGALNATQAEVLLGIRF